MFQNICFLLFFSAAILSGCDKAETADSGKSLAATLVTQWQNVGELFGAGDASDYQPELSKSPANRKKVYYVGIHPLHNPKRLFQVYEPIIERINKSLPNCRLKLEASRNYEEFENKLYSRHFEFAMPNPLQTVKAREHGYQIFGKMADDEKFRGIILVRKDGGIKEIADLKGKAIAYPAKTAVAATLLPQYYLHTHGLDINRDVENRYVGSQESAIMNVVLNHVSASATWPLPWETFSENNPKLADQLEIKWRTDTLPNNGWVVRDDISIEERMLFANALFSLQNDKEGMMLLKEVPVSKFEKASDETYLPVETFIKIYSKTVRPLD